ncbi:MAG: 50S ribosome-binding GTPase [Zoogloea sp.]|nr:50S ribosome-binding GTPase [Zoogloea sp.]
MTLQPTTIQLSLVSHTNTGKTTLARSLIGRDVGEIRDEAHVTALAECHRMIESADGQVLNLWDTPGFGDSARLIKRLRLQGNPVGWLLSEVWDRWRDRPFWSSQQAIRNVREQADVVLYLVNASEKPGEAGYVAPRWKSWPGSANRCWSCSTSSANRAPATRTPPTRPCGAAT